MYKELDLLIDCAYKGFMLEAPILASMAGKTTEQFIKCFKAQFNPNTKTFKAMNNFENKVGFLFLHSRAYIYNLVCSFIKKEFEYDVTASNNFYCPILDFDHKIDKNWIVDIGIQFKADELIITHKATELYLGIYLGMSKKFSSEHYNLREIEQGDYQNSKILKYLEMSVKDYRQMCKQILGVNHDS